MKTNQVMKRDESWIQRTSDSYFNANVLIDYYNKQNNENKQLGNYSKLQGTKDYLSQLISEGIDNPVKSGRGKGKDAGTWMHPKLFIDFAMWLSVEFKSKVIDYVIDGLIQTRHDAGDYYNEMCMAIMTNYIEVKGCKPSPMVYVNEANVIRDIARVGDKKRNEMTEKELTLLTSLQKVNTTLINKKIGRETRRKHLEIIAESL